MKIRSKWLRRYSYRVPTDIDSLFDFIAPMVIYHKADVYYKEEANQALDFLRFVNPNKMPSELRDAVVSDGKVVDDIDSEDFDIGPLIELYDHLFLQIVEYELINEHNVVRSEDDIRVGYDKWGGAVIKFRPKDTNFEDELFAGENFHFAFYADSQSIKDRVRDYVEELERRKEDTGYYDEHDEFEDY